MSRQKKGATSEGKVPAPKEGAAEAADSTTDLVVMIETMMDDIKDINSRVQALELKGQRPAENAGVQEVKSGERSEPATEVGERETTPPEQQSQPPYQWLQPQQQRPPQPSSQAPPQR